MAYTEPLISFETHAHYALYSYLGKSFSQFDEIRYSTALFLSKNERFIPPSIPSNNVKPFGSIESVVSKVGSSYTIRIFLV